VRQLTPRARSAAPSCWRPRSVLPRPRHLHLLRHRQLQPDADGDHGPAPARRVLRQPRHAAARRADREAAERALAITALGNDYTPVGRMIDERPSSTAIVGLMATGGSTNHTIHLIAMARGGGIAIDLDDIRSDSFRASCRCWPRLSERLADVNHFHAAGGMGFLIRELLDAGCCTRTCAPCGATACALRGRAEAGRDGASTGAPAPPRAATRRFSRRRPTPSSRAAG
jgi:phosphogluconate dehydratase